jgi:hypothetical protein
MLTTLHEYNVVAVALNQWLSDLGVGQFVPYIQDETAVPCSLMTPWPRSA